MLVLPGTIILLVCHILRPFELFDGLRGLPLLHVACASAIAGYLLDLRVGLSSFRWTKFATAACLWAIWAVVATIVSAPSAAVPKAIEMVILLVSTLLIAVGVNHLRAFETVATAILACSVWICIVCVHQSFQPLECVTFDPELAWSGDPTGVSCTDRRDCEGGDIFAMCARVGLFGVSSYYERVRYIGILQDPNEVAMFVGSCMPLAIAFYQRKPGMRRRVLLIVVAVLTVWTVMLTQSRGGMVVLAAVFGSYAIQRWGIVRTLKYAWPFFALAYGYLATRPERADAEESTMKRLGCQLAGVEMMMKQPLTGVGVGQFIQHHDQTAHNTYVLSAAETGIVGFWAWATSAFLALKSAMFAQKAGDENSPSKIWGVAVATSLVGMFVGIFFLSFAYHPTLWALFALAAVLPSVANRQATVTVRPGELGKLLLGCMAIMLTVYVYTTTKLT